MPRRKKIDPLIAEFLDCKSSIEKIRVLHRHRQEWTKEHLIVLESSLELSFEEEEDVDAHLKKLLRVLEMKKKYEEPWL